MQTQSARVIDVLVVQGLFGPVVLLLTPLTFLAG
jgi:hypothetical protein